METPDKPNQAQVEQNKFEFVLNTVWLDFQNLKKGEEYLSLYIQRHQKIRRWFKVLTIVLSSSAIGSAVVEFKVLTITATILTAIVQLILSVESYLIHSEESIEKLSVLRVKYHASVLSFETLYRNSWLQSLTAEELERKLSALRVEKIQLEEMDSKSELRFHRKLDKLAEERVRQYIKQYYGI